ncbi:alpha-L-arabinofuranosidase C-terminal domain-containing protein [Mucilaginibacter sp. OK098]|uniref:alpha-L-arabinofuranosidase C-terminal domain-containing protein n=1 Tax=Mucilaginibacter sp. OK098 TaxID=1855297 RepID=UPI00091D07C6|nr:alpha-L-arabinofuranosidase C-terminal domain-containing protein [Mucilaginibacter sp. OK098]SHM72413.1 alpha-N-arabinofuranosidase [Mucilaginibacter sp. OK098]
MKKLLSISSLCLFLFTATSLKAQSPKLTLDLTKPGANVSPQLYGLMTEEINHSYDGGLYAELIKNRIFKDNPNTPEAWSVIKEGSAKATIQLVAANPDYVPADQRRYAINGALTTCLRLLVDTGGGRAGIANEGYWGIPVLPNTTYNASFYIKGTEIKPLPNEQWAPKPTVAVPVIADNTAGRITVSIESNDGKTVYATGTINLVKSTFWKKYELKLITGADVKPTSAARFVISTNRTGVYYFNLVSLFPPTYHNRPNGNRIDIMKLLADMKPRFLRFPGGNFLEGPKLNDAFPWKTTLGPLEGRPGHTGSWGYRPTDGMGLLEFLEWCEDLKMEPLLAVYAGYSLDGDHVDSGPLLKPYVEDALNEIEYVTGDVHTYWGAKRAADGHPAPFKLSYVEIGNEDGFDDSGSYDGRFAQFYDGIKSKYPNLHCIATIGGKDWLGGRGKLTIRKPEIVDEHYYRNAWGMEEDAAHYDNYDRNGYKVFVGEWATTEGTPTTNLNAALGDAAWMTGMERNSDLVIRSCYAPLFANVNKATATAPKAWQWDSNLIGYDALTSFGSPSYYVQAMFNSYIGNKVVPILGINIPTQTRSATKQDSATNKMPEPIPAMFYVATQDTKTGKLFLKIVNTTGKPQQVDIDLKGAGKLSPEGIIVVIKGDKPEDTNTVGDPVKIVPVTSKIKVAGAEFTRTFDPYSVSMLQINTLTK